MMTEPNLPASTATGEIPPMPFGFTLSRVYRILRDHMKVFLGIGAPPAVAMMLLYGLIFWLMFANLRPFLTPNNGSPMAAAGAQLAMMRIVYPVTLLAMIPITVVIAFYLAAAFNAGNKIDSGMGTSVGECFGEAWSRLGRSLGLLLWIYFRAFGALFAIEVVLFGLSTWFAGNELPQNLPIAAFAILPLIWLLLVAASVYGTIVALRMCLAFPAMIEEGLTAGEAIRRSSHLTHGSKGRIFLLLLVMELIGCACIFVLEILAGLVFGVGALVVYLVPNHSTNTWTTVGVLVGAIAGLGLLILFYVWIALLYASLVVTLSVVYHDQRRRKDASLPAQLRAAGNQMSPPGAQPA
jgi:membrane-anchored glycerophosphoryl diester phosphodiesterase (GDPDase)